MTVRKIRVVINVQSVTKHRSGIGEYVRQLVLAFLKRHQDQMDVFLFDGKKIHSVKTTEHAESIWLEMPEGKIYSVSTQRTLAWLLRKRKFDLYFSPEFIIPLLNYSVPMVATLHDIIPLVIPHSLQQSKKARMLFLYRWMLRRTITRCKRIITDSETSKRDLMQCLNAPIEKIDVIYLAAPERQSFPGESVSELRKKLREKKYFLFIGRRDPYKGLTILVRAFLRFKKELPNDYALVIAGPPDSRFVEYKALIDSSDYKQDVLDIGYVAEAELPHLYTHAFAVVCPSLYEGFGLPALTAMTYGTPVISSNRGSLPEVVGDAALLFDPEHDDECLQALVELHKNDKLRLLLSEKGKTRSIDFRWSKTAEQTLNTFLAVAHESL